MNHRSHWACHWLYDDKDIIEIHQPMPTDCCSRKGLQQFRALSLLLMSGVYFWQVAISKSFFVEIQYFTLHGVFLAWLYFSLISIDSYINRKGEAHETCEGLKYWISLIYECGICFQVPITLIYWLLLFQYDKRRLKTRYLVLFALQHSVPILLLTIDFIFNRYRFKLVRLIPILLYGIIYLIINISYTLAARPVYPIMKWKDGVSVLYAVATCVLISVTFLGFRLMSARYKGRMQQDGQDRSREGHYELQEERDT